MNLRTRRINRATATAEADCELQKLSDRIDGHLLYAVLCCCCLLPAACACPSFLLSSWIVVRPAQQQRLNERMLTSGGRFGGAFKLNYILTNGSSAPLPVDGLPTALWWWYAWPDDCSLYWTRSCAILLLLYFGVATDHQHHVQPNTKWLMKGLIRSFVWVVLLMVRPYSNQSGP